LGFLKSENDFRGSQQGQNSQNEGRGGANEQKQQVVSNFKLGGENLIGKPLTVPMVIAEPKKGVIIKKKKQHILCLQKHREKNKVKPKETGPVGRKGKRIKIKEFTVCAKWGKDT